MGIVTMSEVLDAAGDFRRPLIEGDAILQSKMLITVGRLGSHLVEGCDDVLKIWALCLQTSSLLTSPHVIKVTIDTSTQSNRIKHLSCSCKAGTSEKCKHVIATLMFLHRINDESELEELSSTDVDQQWGKLKAGVKEDFEAIPIKNYFHVKEPVPIYSRGLPSVSDDEAVKFAQLLINGEPNSEIFHHSAMLRAEACARSRSEEEEEEEEEERDVDSGSEQASLLSMKILEKGPSDILQSLIEITEGKHRSLNSELSHFFKNTVKVSKEQCASIASGTVSQANDLWFKERSVRITGSRCYSLFTYRTNKNPDWEKKLTSVFKSTFCGNAATVYGLTCEPLAREVYEAKKKVKVMENRLFIHPDLPLLGYSADGIVVSEEGDPQFLLEVKCPTRGKSTLLLNWFPMFSTVTNSPKS